MKRLFLFLSIIAVTLSSCLKDTPNVDFSTLKPVVEISSANFTSTPNTLASGLENFGNAGLIFAIMDSNVTFNINYADVNPPKSDVSVSIGVNDAARNAYNANSAVQFQPFPAGTFSLASNSVTIHAGTRIATVTVHFRPSLIDPTQSYMLPLTITDASGNTISGNFNTIYLHQIGNPIAGSYSWDFTRYNNAQGTGTPSSLSFIGGNTTFIPTSPTNIEVRSGYYNQPRYEVSFTNNNGVLSNFQVSLNADDVKYMNDNGITIVSGPTILAADPVNHVFEFQYTTNARYIIDKYYK